MTLVTAILALFVSLVALWMASANGKKIESGNRELKAQINADLEKIKKDIMDKIDVIERKIGAFDGKMEGIIEGQMQAKETAGLLEKEVAAVSRDLASLTDGLPPQFRQNRDAKVKSEFG